MTRATLAPTWIATQGRARSLRARLMARRGMPDGQLGDLQRRLSRLHSPGELKAALLGLMVTPGNRRELRVWRQEVCEVPHSAGILADVEMLEAPARLPWFELFAERAALTPVAHRQDVVQAARTLMQAGTRVRDGDRLRWMALRQWLGDPRPRVMGAAGADNALESLHSAQVESIGVFTAFLSRLVPEPEIVVEPDADTDGPRTVPMPSDDGERWYRLVMSRWEPRVPVTAPGRPDSDAWLRSLRSVQALPWMVRPVLVRAWFDAAHEVMEGDPLPLASADAIRLSCALLDCPMPAELSQLYFEALRKP